MFCEFSDYVWDYVDSWFDYADSTNYILPEDKEAASAVSGLAVLYLPSD